MEAAEIAQSLGLMALKSHPWHIQATCALTGQGLQEVLISKRLKMANLIVCLGDGLDKSSDYERWKMKQRVLAVSGLSSVSDAKENFLCSGLPISSFEI